MVCTDLRNDRSPPLSGIFTYGNGIESNNHCHAPVSPATVIWWPSLCIASERSVMYRDNPPASAPRVRCKMRKGRSLIVFEMRWHKRGGRRDAETQRKRKLKMDFSAPLRLCGLCVYLFVSRGFNI